MRPIFSTSLTILFTCLGAFMFANGVFHLAIYLVEGSSLFGGLRFINWFSIVGGIGLFYLGMKISSYDRMSKATI